MNKTVLIVDDDADLREAVCEKLRPITDEKNAILKQAKDGQDALDKFDGSVVLVISDLNMPRMRGIDLLKALRKRGSQVPFLLWSSMMDHEETALERMKAKELNAVCFRKPLTWDKDLNMVEEWIKRTIQSPTTVQSPKTI